MGLFQKESDQRTSAEKDAATAWLYASNCLLYENDPGPAQLNIGSVTEPAWVSRSDAWRDAYAHAMIVATSADHGHLTAAAGVCRAELAHVNGPRDAWNAFLFRFRRRVGKPDRLERLKYVVGAFSPGQAGEFRQVWRRAIDLCELASGLVVEAGAMADDKARRRLLAGSRHTLAMSAMGNVIPFIAQDSTDRLNRELDEIDNPPEHS
jgi:hypothetical protein